jgi:hypothetical protein
MKPSVDKGSSVFHPQFHKQFLFLSGFLILLTFLLLPFKSVYADANICPVNVNPGQCLCHNYDKGAVENCPSGNGEVSGHDCHLDCFCCTHPSPLPPQCDPAQNGGITIDCSQLGSCSVTDKFGKCNGCGNGLLECCGTVNGKSECCLENDPSCNKTTHPNCEQCDDSNNIAGDGCSADCKIECKTDNDCPDDGNPCTNDICDQNTHFCAHPNNTAPCDDGDQCTVNDVCAGGVCTPGPQEDCSDGISCTLDFCANHQTGECAHNPSGCECQTDLDCDDQNDCTNEFCDLSSFSCVRSNNSNSCDDGIFCNGTDTCGEGSCSIHSGDPCANGLQCDNTCNEANQNCHAPDGTSCDDTDACTQTDTCQNGGCVGSNPVVCTALDQCHDLGTCNPDTGECSNPSKEDGTSCNDGVNCTENDTCTSGECAGTPKVCNDERDCSLDDHCDEETGDCVFDLSTCKCSSNGDCDDHNSCTHDVCDIDHGTCSNEPVENGTQCDDGSANTDDDHCENGHCVGCGNGIKNVGETCDTGNSASDACPAGTQCNAPGSGPNECKCTVCGNGIKGPSEECDDGSQCADGTTCQICDCVNFPNSACCSGPDSCGALPGDTANRCGPRGGDGCSADCKIEQCDNGTLDVGEQCEFTDETHTAVVEGSKCGVETCGIPGGKGKPAPCNCAVCGNGSVATNDLMPEQCDEGAKCDDGTSCDISKNTPTPNEPGANTQCVGHGATNTCAERASATCSADCTLIKAKSLCSQGNNLDPRLGGLAAQGICDNNVEGSGTGCIMVPGATGVPLGMLVPLLAAVGMLRMKKRSKR